MTIYDGWCQLLFVKGNKVVSFADINRGVADFCGIDTCRTDYPNPKFSVKTTLYLDENKKVHLRQQAFPLLKSKYYAGKSAKENDENWAETIDFLGNKSEAEKEDAETETPGILAHRTEVLAIHQEQSGRQEQAYNGWTQGAEDILD